MPVLIAAGHPGPAAGHRGQRPHRLGLGPVRGGRRPLRRHPRAAPAARLLALRGRRSAGPPPHRAGHHPQPGAGGRAGLGRGRRADRGGRPRPRGPVGGSGRGRGRGHLSVRLVQRIDRGHLLLRHAGLLAAHHPGLAGPPGQLARGGRRGRPRAPGRIPPVDRPVVRRAGPHRRGRPRPGGWSRLAVTIAAGAAAVGGLVGAHVAQSARRLRRLVRGPPASRRTARPRPPRSSTTPPPAPPISAPSPPTPSWPSPRWPSSPLLAGLALGVRRPVRSPASRAAAHRPARRPSPGRRETGPWYQTRTAILAAAIVPPVALVALVQFAKGGYLLAYLPAAVISLLARCSCRRRFGAPVGARRVVWLVVTSLGVGAVAALGTQRFLDGNGVLPRRWTSASGASGSASPATRRPTPTPAPPSAPPTPSTPRCGPSAPPPTPIATSWSSTPSTAAPTSTATPAGPCPTTGSP